MANFTKRYLEILDMFDCVKWQYDTRYQRYWARLDNCQFEVEVKESNDGYEGCVVVDGQVVLESQWQKRLADAKGELAGAIALRDPTRIFLPYKENEHYPSERVS